MTGKLDHLCRGAAARLIDSIRSGQAGEWQVPWHIPGALVPPVNALTGRTYTGGNWVLALLVAFDNGDRPRGRIGQEGV